MDDRSKMKKSKKVALPQALGAAARSARLAELERLTGCPVEMVIEGRCQEVGCQNKYIQLDEHTALPTELCRRLKSLVSSECALLEDDVFQHLDNPEAPAGRQAAPKPVIDIRLRQRCVL